MKKNKGFWENRALNPDIGKDSVTHADRNQRSLEIEFILKNLPPNSNALDIGCGNGYSTAVFSEYCSRIVGADYSEAMIDRARREFGHIKNIVFECKDIMCLDFSPGTFDVAISQRCLINLPNWEAQAQAIATVSKVLKPRGIFFLQEGSRQGRERLNQFREALGLCRMPEVDYNLDFDEERLWPLVHRWFEIVQVERFGLYDLISRIIHPLLVSPSEPSYDAKINDIARRISSKLQGCDDLSREFSAFLRRFK